MFAILTILGGLIMSIYYISKYIYKRNLRNYLANCGTIKFWQNKAK